ncbi:MAG: TonB-dependent receptor, partial [Gammaproteobacteria bacterium]|nr:TonB-dependent receptor [Gammaproteobacteria bacterium]
MSGTSRYALTPLAAAVSAALAPHSAATAQEGAAPRELEEIIVTARKREESLQEIPAAIQAIPQATLEKMGATGVADYSRFIPAVNVVSYFPGSTDIVFRGVQAGGVDIGQAPSSMYIDEMAVTASGSQPEVRMYDINRIESLDGPQGTLYGGSAQSGTLRVITNQPDPSQFEGSVDLTVRQGPDTGLSHDISGMINLPLADNRAALRLAGFTATDAGFIDNVFGHTPDTHQWYTLPPSWGVEDNAEVVEEEWNDVDYIGARVALRWEFSDAWAATVGYMTQSMDGNGGNHFDPFVGDLQVVKFNDETRYDDWSLASLTVEGDVGWAQIVSATSFFDRDYGNVTDSTVYTKYYQSWACLYQLDPATYTGYFVDPSTGAALVWPRYCFGPSSLSDTLVEQQFDDQLNKFSQEFRISGGSDRLDWILGLYYERVTDDWASPWGRVTNSSYQDSVANLYWEGVYGPNFAPNATHGWESISQVDYEQTAVFGEITWRLNDQWTANVGARWFDRTMDSVYWVENPNTQPGSEYVDAGGGFSPAVASGGTDDVVPKINIAYQPTEN